MPQLLHPFLKADLPYLPNLIFFVKRDAIFYKIFKRFPNLFFELIGQPPALARGYRFESIEVKEPSFRIDGVFLPPEDASPKIVFFAEVQFQKDQSLYHRFFSELFLYLYRNQVSYDDWYGVLLFPRQGLEPDNSTIHRSLLNGPQVQCLYLDQLEPDEQPLGINLVQLMTESEERMVERARQLIVRARQEEIGNLSREEIIEVIATIAVYKFANLSRQEVEAMLGLSVEQTRVYQEAKEEGLEQGLERGLEQGLERGRREAKLELVPRMLARGFTVEEVAELLDLEVEQVRQVSQPPSQ